MPTPQPAAAAAPAPTERRTPAAARVLALLLALLLVLVMPFAWLAFDLWRVVFNPTLVKSIATDEVVNSDLIPVGLAWFSSQRAEERVRTGEALSGVDEPDIILLMSYLDRADWRAIRMELLTNEFLSHLVSVTVDETYAWIDSAERVPAITWELQPFKDRALSEHGVNAITIAYGKLPRCTQPEIDDFTGRLSAAPAGVEVLYNLCQFPDPWHTDQVSDYVHAVTKVVSNVPNEFALTERLQASADNPQGIGPEAIKARLRLIRLLGSLAWLPLLVLLLLILALAVRSLRGLSRWWGLPLLIGGLLTLLPALVYRPLFTGVLSGGPLSETPEAVRQEALRALLRLADQVFVPLLIEAVIACALGLGLLVWRAVARPRAAPRAPVNMAPAKA